jgi:type IV pilus assembly protein PilM
MFNLFELNPESFGLDFSDLSLRVARLKKRGKFFRLASWGEKEINSGIIENGEIKDETALCSVLKETLRDSNGERIRIKNVMISFPEEKAFMQVIQMPKMDEKELKTAVRFEAENHIPLPMEKMYFDFQAVQPQSNHLDHLDVLIAAIPKEIADSYISCVKKVGLCPQALEVESMSISRALIKDGLSLHPVLIIDFGRSTTSLVIFSGYSLRFTATIPVCSDNLTRAISKSLEIDLSKAEKMKIKQGLNFSKKESDVFEALIPALTDLVEQVEKFVDYYQAHAGHEHSLSTKGNGKIEKIILCGRGSNLKGLPEFINLKLKIPVELGNPWVNILPKQLKEVPGLSFDQSLGYTTALGLALRGVKKL